MLQTVHGGQRFYPLPSEQAPVRAIFALHQAENGKVGGM